MRFGVTSRRSYIAGDIAFAVRLVGLRAVAEAVEGDGEAAARSLYSAIRGRRYFDQNQAPLF
jgi:hypothetical protein